MVEKQSEIFVHVFFVDVVSLSNRKLGSTEDQIKKIETLFNMITKSEVFKKSGGHIIPALTGDGVVICFKKSPRYPFDLALDIHKKLRRYNKNLSKKNKIQVRIGINSGLIYKTKGVGNRSNYWGRGIIYAQRIMNIGNADHILLDGNIATELSEISNAYKKLIHYQGTVKVKHGASIAIYSVYDQTYGNKKKPSSLKRGITPELERTGRLIIEELSKREMDPQVLLKILQQKEESKKQLSLLKMKRNRMRKQRKKWKLTK